jgi:hypothetical protein
MTGYRSNETAGNVVIASLATERFAVTQQLKMYVNSQKSGNIPYLEVARTRSLLYCHSSPVGTTVRRFIGIKNNPS